MSIPVLRLISHGALFHIASNLSAPIPVLRSQRFVFRICRHHQGKAIGFIFVEKLRRAICARDLLVTMLFSSFPKWNAVLRAPLSQKRRNAALSCGISAVYLFRQRHLKGTVKSDILLMEKLPPAEQPANCEPSVAGRSWKIEARERADDVLFAPGIERR